MDPKVLAKQVHEACAKKGVQYRVSMPELTIMELLGRIDEMAQEFHRRIEREKDAIKLAAIMETLEALNPKPFVR
jgi:hypothetical protein